MGFLVTVLLVVVVVHYYLWRRLIRSTTRPGSRSRRWLTWALVALAVLLPLALTGSRALGLEFGRVVSWPAYLWLAIMFYLFVFALVAEVPRAIAVLAVGRTRRSSGTGAGGSRGSATATAPAAASPVNSVGAGAVSPGRTVSPGSPGGPSAALGFAVGSATAAGARAAVETAAEGATAVNGEDGPSGLDDRSPSLNERAFGLNGRTRVLDAAVLGRRLFISRTAAAAVGVGALATVGYGMSSALGDPVIERVPVRLARLDPRMNGLRFAVVSDIHLGPMTGRGHTERIVRMINGLQADVVAIVGDLVDGTVAELGPLATPLRSLESRYGAYFVTGNHEYYTANGPQEWIDELDSLGVRSLRNERVEIRHAGAVLDLAGVNDLNGQALGDGPDMAKALTGRDSGRPVVLLAHQPLQVQQAAELGVDLQLSGHTHGGQMAPFNLLVPLQQPVVAGLAAVARPQPGAADGIRPDVTQVYVTRGAGSWGPPVRVGAPPEITLIELRA